MSSSANEELSPMILTRSEGKVDLIMDYLAQGWAEKVALTREAWDMMAPLALSDWPEAVLALHDLEDDVLIEFENDAHSQSLMRLATLVEHMSPVRRLADLVECWVALSRDQRAGFRRRGTNDKTVQAQLLGTRCQGAQLMETHVPDWLPKLVDASENLFVPTVGYRIYWTWVDSPLGASCIAWRDLHPDGITGYLAMSSCPVSFAPAHDPDRTIARSAIDVLIAARNAIAAGEIRLRNHDWNPTGHDLLEIEAILQEWRGRLS